MIDRLGFEASTDVNATDFPNGSFANVPLRSLDTAADLSSQPEPIALFSYAARTESLGTIRARNLARLSPTSMGFDHQATDENTLQAIPYEPIMEPVSSGIASSISISNGQGFFGGSYSPVDGQSYLVTVSYTHLTLPTIYSV